MGYAGSERYGLGDWEGLTLKGMGLGSEDKGSERYGLGFWRILAWIVYCFCILLQSSDLLETWSLPPSPWSHGGHLLHIRFADCTY